MKITLLYFAAVRDLVGVAEEVREIPDDVVSMRELAEVLARAHGALAGRLGAVRFARNETFVGDDEPIADGDVVALIPPVSGG